MLLLCSMVVIIVLNCLHLNSVHVRTDALSEWCRVSLGIKVPLPFCSVYTGNSNRECIIKPFQSCQSWPIMISQHTYFFLSKTRWKCQLFTTATLKQTFNLLLQSAWKWNKRGTRRKRKEKVWKKPGILEHNDFYCPHWKLVQLTRPINQFKKIQSRSIYQ